MVGGQATNHPRAGNFMNSLEIGRMAASLEASHSYYFGKRKRSMPSSAFSAFHNALRILRALDFYEISFLKDAEWYAFRDNPYDFFITTSDSNASLIWEAVQRRQPKELKQNGS
jgi:hypothetical protein